MASKQNDTMALGEEQLDGVSGGFIVGPVGSRSIEPNPSPSPISIAPLPSPHPRPDRIVDPTYIVDPIFRPRR